MTGGFVRRLAETEEPCLRGAANALLSLAGAREAVGLNDVATAQVDARPGLSHAWVAAPDDEPVSAPNRPVRYRLAAGPPAGGGSAAILLAGLLITILNSSTA
ncbi:MULTISPECIES: hypothetical protein [Streptomyces]|uniref:Uncharacterized protein n=2 Tax=Streptomyces TaxID=1883 RepID=A0A100Y0U4_9ACTN|nr:MULTISPECIES: hypothetical protein [Streptomyces]KUH35635.1 hypothetical protein ATE80_28090 [Streptomyces kanasensis]UUS35083.1 hypothetical protein NRO40_30175 [Streptomyces changanensis]